MKLTRGEIKPIVYWPIGLGLGLILFSDMVLTTAEDQGRSLGGLICIAWLLYAVPTFLINKKIEIKRQTLQALATKELLLYMKRLEDELSPPHVWPTTWTDSDYEKLHTLYQVRGEVTSRTLSEAQRNQIFILRAKSDHQDDLKSFQSWFSRESKDREFLD
jgi:hypothetical protein